MMLIVGNWKMNSSRVEGFALTQQVAEFVDAHPQPQREVVLCPPHILLLEMSGFMTDGLRFGGQDCHAELSGAHTGDTSAAMIEDTGASYVILGHSERRSDHGETSAQVAAKAKASHQAGLKPIICIGETLDERESGQYEAVLKAQIAASIPAEFSAEDYVLAYEPVWAIGTGKVADGATIEATHRFIAQHVPAGVAILYGGSVKPANAVEILSTAHVGGVLVGGASLQADDFNAIIAASDVALKQQKAA